MVNFAIELNGQQPIQTYVKPCKEYHVVLRSIDLGASEIVETYGQLADFKKVGSPFSIPKAALALAGFLPQYSGTCYPDLKTQLADFGCGMEDVKKAMQPFYTSHPEQERTGIGFSLMQSFMDGVSVTSSPGSGTLVRMTKRLEA